MGIEHLHIPLVGLAIVALSVAERVRPRRAEAGATAARWRVNLGLAVVVWLLAPLVAPLLGVGAAVWAGNQGVGLFRALALPAPLAGVLGAVALDAMHYARHVALHHPLLWRIHRVHHTDAHVDWSTGLRFHPLEFVLSAASDVALIVGLGVPVAAVLAFHLLMAVVTLAQHSNWALPSSVDRRLRRVFVTPDFHRVHHSADAQEFARNFSSLFAFWDRLFGTALETPSLGHERMRIGLEGYPQERTTSLWLALADPFLAADRSARAIARSEGA